MSVSHVTTPTDIPDVSHNTDATPLSKEEKASFIQNVMSGLSLTEKQATDLANLLPPEAVRTFMDLSSGKTSITREDAQKMWGLTDDEADAMFGDKKQIGVFDNPFGDLFLQFLMLSYSLGLDIKKMMVSVSGLRFEQAVDAAKDRKAGATDAFICSMVAAGTSAAFAAGSFYRINQLSKDKANPHDPALQWFTPMTASLFTQPLNGIGEFTKALDEYKAQVLDGNNQLQDSIFQQLMNTWQSTNDASRTYTSGL